MFALSPEAVALALGRPMERQSESDVTRGPLRMRQAIDQLYTNVPAGRYPLARRRERSLEPPRLGALFCAQEVDGIPSKEKLVSEGV